MVATIQHLWSQDGHDPWEENTDDSDNAHEPAPTPDYGMDSVDLDNLSVPSTLSERDLFGAQVRMPRP